MYNSCITAVAQLKYSSIACLIDKVKLKVGAAGSCHAASTRGSSSPISYVTMVYTNFSSFIVLIRIREYCAKPSRSPKWPTMPFSAQTCARALVRLQFYSSRALEIKNRCEVKDSSDVIEVYMYCVFIKYSNYTVAIKFYLLRCIECAAASCV